MPVRQVTNVRRDTRTEAGLNRTFIFVGQEKLYIRGVTYGPFRPDENGYEYLDPKLVEQDFTQMVANGLNAVRTYTVPPRWLLDLAEQHGLRVMIGLPWQQHVTFLDGREQIQAILDRVRAGVRVYAGHPAVLCYAIGNEIPAPRAAHRALSGKTLSSSQGRKSHGAFHLRQLSFD